MSTCHTYLHDHQCKIYKVYTVLLPRHTVTESRKKSLADLAPLLNLRAREINCPIDWALSSVSRKLHQTVEIQTSSIICYNDIRITSVALRWTKLRLLLLHLLKVCI